MVGEQARRALAILGAAVELEDSALDAFLTEACAGDRELRLEVEQLLAADRRALELRAERPAAGPAGAAPQAFQGVVCDGTRYVRKGELARGGMGAVLKVFDTSLRRHLAMKVVLGRPGVDGDDGDGGGEVDPRILARFLEEAQVTGQLDHPGVVPVHELGVDPEGRAYFTMRLVQGRDLSEIIAEVHSPDGAWTRTRALGVLQRVCETMAFAHDRGVLHRDLKPANVRVGRYGEVYVMDWGLARVEGVEDTRDLRLSSAAPSTPSAVRTELGELRESHLDSPLLTMDGTVLGTPFFMPPEQAAGRIEEVDARSDVYAVGAMLYNVLTGRMPYHQPGSRPGPHEVLAQVRSGPPAPLRELAPDVPAELEAICEKAMSRSVAGRYDGMGALADDLRAFLEHRVVRAYRVGTWVELRKWIWRNRALSWASAVALALAVGGLVAVGLVQAAGRRAAESERALAVREGRKVLRLSALRRLEDLVEEADALWPPYPERTRAYADWLAAAQELLSGLEPDPATGDPGHHDQLEEIRARALPWTPEERERTRRSHPRYPELAVLKGRIAALRRAQAVRDGGEPPRPDLSGEALPRHPDALNARIWPLVDPHRTVFGEEARGLALAEIAIGLAEGVSRAEVGDTLAWARFAVGLDAEALAAGEAALRDAPEKRRREFESSLAQLKDAVDAVRGEQGRAAIRGLEEQLAELEREVAQRREWRFANDTDRWWHEQLTALVRRLEDLAESRTSPRSGISAEHGWGIVQRLAFAGSVGERTLHGQEALGLWEEARAAIAIHPDYGGLDLPPQAGLLPLGPDPDSGLWEFAHLQSGAPAARGADGRLVPSQDMGVVLVLIPAGTFVMGAQRWDPLGPNYDPKALRSEAPTHAVGLSAFFFSKYELTQGQWIEATGSNPSGYSQESKDRLWLDPERPLLHPVENVSWIDCARVLAWLGLDLPSEAQWEYAARARTSTPWWTGREPSTLSEAANLVDASPLKLAGNQLEDWSDGFRVHAPVTAYRANAFGLHGVHGNVSEWCRDVFEFGYYAWSPATDPVCAAPPTGPLVVRGGQYLQPPAQVRSAARGYASAHSSTNAIGVRPARRIDP